MTTTVHEAFDDDIENIGDLETEAATRRREDVTTLVLAELGAERRRQDEKWGEQNHPDGTGPVERQGACEQRELFRDVCDSRAALGVVTFADILLEEVYEALAEADPKALRAELVQVGAVAAGWIEKIDRDLAKAADPPTEPPC